MDLELVETHSAGCERTEKCLGCGTPIKAQKCHCGFWMVLCGPCEAKKTLADTKAYVARKLEEMRKDYARKLDEIRNR